MTRALLLSLALLPASLGAEEPFVTKPSLRARLLFYGAPVAGDTATTLWARARGAVELNPGLQEPALMVAFKVAQAAFLVWLDGALPERLRWARWVLRGAAVAGYGYLMWRNYHNGKLSLSLSS